MFLNLPLHPQQITGPIILAILSIVCFFTQSVSLDWLAYERQLVEQGEWWRIVTANLLHTNKNHLLLNLTGVFMLWALHGDYYRTHWYLFITLISGIGCSLGIYLFSAELLWYVGLSGALHGLFAWGAIIDIKQGLKTGWLLLIGLIGKIIWELTQGASEHVASLIEAQVATEAHLFGALSGLIIAGGYLLISSKTPPSFINR